jgi:glycosyltransferase involved in cell wall biosynthesis
MLEQFAANDLLCIPSRSEALGIAFMEALAAGLPAIGTNVGGIPEVLDDGRAGWLATPYDIDDIARQIRSVCEDAALRERKRRHGLDHVQRFSTDAMVVRFNELANVAMSR